MKFARPESWFRMFSRRSDLPLDDDSLNRFLPWLIAFMVYLASLAMAGVMVLNSAAAGWDRGMNSTLTVQIPPAPSPDAAGDRKRVDLVLSVLRSTPGVVRAEDIDKTAIMILLEPWLGKSTVGADLPLPGLIDVEINPDLDIDMEALAHRLGRAVPDAAVDDHRVWLKRIINLIRSVEILAGAILALIAMATIGTVVFTTRTGIAIHQEAIEVLHLIGAQDIYVARQFAGRALSLGLRGGVIGLALAGPTLLGIGKLARRMDSGIMPDFAMSMENWLVIASLPLVVAIIAMFAARQTVLRNLSRMP